jgi:hypothetical protein
VLFIDESFHSIAESQKRERSLPAAACLQSISPSSELVFSWQQPQTDRFWRASYEYALAAAPAVLRVLHALVG